MSLSGWGDSSRSATCIDGSQRSLCVVNYCRLLLFLLLFRSYDCSLADVTSRAFGRNPSFARVVDYTLMSIVCFILASGCYGARLILHQCNFPRHQIKFLIFCQKNLSKNYVDLLSVCRDLVQKLRKIFAAEQTTWNLMNNEQNKSLNRNYFF